MNIVVTAGNTVVPIDQVRCITNIFSGRTGTRIALHAHKAGHNVTLLTSHPELVAEMGTTSRTERWLVLPYRTFGDLQNHLEYTMCRGNADVLIHCAAVSDYQSAGIYGLTPGTKFDPEQKTWQSEQGPPQLVDRAAGKVKSDEPELWLRLVRTPKLIGCVRTEWDFHGILVKFKLEVGLRDEALLDVAERSRRHSDADLMVANTLEGAYSWAFLGPVEGQYQRVARADLAVRLLEAVERCAQERKHG